MFKLLAPLIVAIAMLTAVTRVADERPMREARATSTLFAEEMAPRTLSVIAERLEMPVRYEWNGGQLAPHVRFAARAKGYELSVLEHGLDIAVGGAGDHEFAMVSILLVGMTPDATLEGVVPVTGNSERFTGQGARSSFRRVTWHPAFDGIDLVLHGHGGAPGYEWLLAAGADPDRIRVRFTGATFLEVNDRGELVIGTPHGTITQARPEALQMRDGIRTPVQASYVLDAGTGDVGILLGEYDHEAPLKIDQALHIVTHRTHDVAHSPRNASALLHAVDALQL